MTAGEQATNDAALKAGREAIERHAWQEALELLSAADAQSPLAAEDLDRLADAAMWALQPEECIRAYERAYAAYVDSGRRRQAARAAGLLIAELNATQGAESVVAGWISRVARLLKDEPECVEQGISHTSKARDIWGQVTRIGPLPRPSKRLTSAASSRTATFKARAAHAGTCAGGEG